MRTPLSWASVLSRPLRTPATLLGGNQAIESLAALAGIAAVLALLGVRLRFTRSIATASIAAGAIYLPAPDGAFHTVLLPERCAALLVVLVVGWSAHLTVQFRKFEGEMRSFDDLLARMEPGKIVRVVTVDSRSDSIPGYPMFWSVGAWYQVEKGGLVGFSFSRLFPSLVRYRSTPPWAERLWAPRGELRWRPEDASIDYFVFRSVAGDPASLFPVEAGRPTLLARSGGWWLYTTSRAAPQPPRLNR